MERSGRMEVIVTGTGNYDDAYLMWLAATLSTPDIFCWALITRQKVLR